MKLEEIFSKQVDDNILKETSPLMLAFIGDAVHTLFVRDTVVKQSSLLIKDYHKKAAEFCRAKDQASRLDLLVPTLSNKELDIVRRARNAKTNNIAKHSDIETYKKATSYEALIGYLYLTANYQRLNEILKI